MDTNDLNVMLAHLTIHGWRPAKAFIKKHGRYQIVHNGAQWYTIPGLNGMVTSGTMDQLAECIDAEWGMPDPKAIAKLIEAIADFEGGEDG